MKGKEFNFIYWILILLTAAVFFLPSLFMELDLDEFGSFWVVKDDLFLAIKRSIEIQGQSPLYYCILWIFVKVFGFSSIAMRSFSLICAMISCILIHKLGKILFGKIAGFYSPFFFIASFSVIASSTTARPYAFAITLMLASSILLIKWCQKYSIKYLIIYILSLLGMIYAHYLFVFILSIHFIWLLLLIGYLKKNERKIFIKQCLIGLFLFCLGILPCIYQLKILKSKSDVLSFSSLPSILQVVFACCPSEMLLMLILMIGILLSYQICIGRKTGEKSLALEDFSTQNVLFILSWSILPVIYLAIISLAMGRSIWVDRYLSMRVGGLSLLSGFLVSLITIKALRITISILYLAIMGYFFYHLENMDVAQDGFGRASIEIVSNDNNAQCTTLLLSGFIESSDTQLLQDELVSGFIRSPLDYFGLQNKIILLPYSVADLASLEYFSNYIKPKILKSDCLWLVYRNSSLIIKGEKPPMTSSYLAENLPLLGFRTIFTHNFGRVILIYFKKNLVQ